LLEKDNQARAIRNVTLYHSFNIAQKCFKNSDGYFWILKKFLVTSFEGQLLLFVKTLELSDCANTKATVAIQRALALSPADRINRPTVTRVSEPK
jgi:hypothetical protein